MVCIRVVAGAAAVMCLGSVVLADDVTLTPSQDNTLYQTPLNSDLSNGAGQDLFVGETMSNVARRAVLAFDLSSIPAGSTINSATLTLFMNRAVSSGSEIGAHRLLASWGEGASNAGDPGGGGTAPATNDATWNYRFFDTLLWTTPGGDYVAAESSSALVGAAPMSYSWSAGLAPDVQAWLDQPSANFGWIMIGDERTAGSAVRFDSREGTHPPTLQVSFTPPSHCGSADFNCDGSIGTDADIEAFFACLSGACPPPPCASTADFNGDGSVGTDADIESFFRVLSGAPC
jgi:hypothetical protein